MDQGLITFPYIPKLGCCNTSVMIQCNYIINRRSINSDGNVIAVVFNVGLFVLVIFKRKLSARRPNLGEHIGSPYFAL